MIQIVVALIAVFGAVLPYLLQKNKELNLKIAGKYPTKWTDLARKRGTLPSILDTGTKFPGKTAPRQVYLLQML